MRERLIELENLLKVKIQKPDNAKLYLKRTIDYMYVLLKCLDEKVRGK